MHTTIRHTEITDLKSIMSIYEYARAQMQAHGNPNQWRDIYPPETLIIEDINKKNSYLIEEAGKIIGVFTFYIGEDPNYHKIEGRWLNENTYGVIHRVASSGIKRGVFELCLAYCKSQIANLRIDTHRDNKIMRHKIEKNGFQECGIIYVGDGTPRIAYQRTD